MFFSILMIDDFDFLKLQLIVTRKIKLMCMMFDLASGLCKRMPENGFVERNKSNENRIIFYQLSLNSEIQVCFYDI